MGYTSYVTRAPLSRSKVNLQGPGHIVAASRTACYKFLVMYLLEQNMYVESGFQLYTVRLL